MSAWLVQRPFKRLYSPCVPCSGYFCTPGCLSQSFFSHFSSPPYRHHSLHIRLGFFTWVKCHPLGISASPFVIAEPDDWCVCMYVKEKERERNRTREGIWVYAREGWGEDSCVYDWFSEGVWEDRGWVRDRSPLLGVIKIAITAWEITACLLDTPHLYWVWQEIGARGIVCVGGYLYGQPAETTCKEHANWYSGQGCDSFPHSPLPHTHSFSVATAPSENFLDNRDEPVHNTVHNKSALDN